MGVWLVYIFILNFLLVLKLHTKWSFLNMWNSGGDGLSFLFVHFTQPRTWVAIHSHMVCLHFHTQLFLHKMVITKWLCKIHG
jgi:hypothetical protein